MELKEVKELLSTQIKDAETQFNNIAKDISDKSSDQYKTLESKFNTETETLKKTITSLEEQIKLANAKAVPGLKEELKKHPFDFGMAVSGIYKSAKGASNPWKEVDTGKEMYEKEMMQEAAKLRSNTAGTGTEGGYLIPDEVTSDFIDMTIANMPIVGLGAKVVKGLVGDLPVPKKTARCTAYMVGENSAPTASAVTYGQVTLRPKKCGAFSKQSNRLIYQTRGVSDQIIRADLQDSMRLKMEQELISGTGTGHEPKGLLTHTGFTTSTVSMGSNGGRFKIDNASQMMTDIEVADEALNPNGKYGMLMHPRVKAGMKRERVLQYSTQASEDAQPILPMNLLMTDKVLSDQLGIGIGATTLLPATNTVGTSTTCSKVVYGDWNLFWIGLWRDMMIKVSDVAGDGSTGSAFLDDMLYIVLFQEFDCLVMRESGMTVATGCETTESSW